MTAYTGPINNLIGTFAGCGQAPPPGSVSVTARAALPPAEVVDASNYLRLTVEADFGQGYRRMPAPGDGEWHGGPGQSNPAVTWQFPAGATPLWVRPVLENGTRGDGSPARVNSLTLEFK